MKTISNKGGWPLLMLALMLVNLSSSAQVDSVYYHQYQFTSQYGAGGSYPSLDYYRYATRFTPPYYPAKLTGIKAWFRNAASPSYFRFVVYKDPSASAQGPLYTFTDYMSPGAILNPSSNGVADSAYAAYANLSSSNIIITAGDVYCGVTQYLQTNGFIGIAIDAANTYSTDRPWAYSGVWMKMIDWVFIDGEWGINAYFMPVPTGVTTDDATGVSHFSLMPDPATDHVTLTYHLQKTSSVNIRITNTAGIEVMKITDLAGELPGEHQQDLSMQSLAAGMYLINLRTVDGLYVKKLIKE